MATWKTRKEENDDMNLNELFNNETTRFFVTILKYFGQQLKANWLMMWSGGYGMVKGLLGILALLIAAGLFAYICVMLFTGGVDGDVRGVNVPQLLAIVTAVLVFVSACVPASATYAEGDYETEIVNDEGG